MIEGNNMLMLAFNTGDLADIVPGLLVFSFFVPFWLAAIVGFLFTFSRSRRRQRTALKLAFVAIFFVTSLGLLLLAAHAGSSPELANDNARGLDTANVVFLSILSVSGVLAVITLFRCRP